MDIRTGTRARRVRLLAVGLGLAVAATLTAPSVASAKPVQQGTPTEGGACTVTAGPNKGKKGTYTTDEYGSTWCEGSWGGTECGATKCSSGLVRPRTAPVLVVGVAAR